MKAEDVKIGQIVKVTVRHPSGTTVDALGKIGIVSEIETPKWPNHDGTKLDITVHAENRWDFVFTEAEIEPASDEEIRAKLAEMLRRS